MYRSVQNIQICPKCYGGTKEEQRNCGCYSWRWLRTWQSWACFSDYFFHGMALSAQAVSKMEKPCVSKTGVRMAKPSWKSIPKTGLTHLKWSHRKVEPEMVTWARLGRILVKRMGALFPLLQPRKSPQHLSWNNGVRWEQKAGCGKGPWEQRKKWSAQILNREWRYFQR